MAQDEAKMIQDRANMSKDGPVMESKWARTVQPLPTTGPRGAQEAPKWRPRGAKRRARGLLGSPLGPFFAREIAFASGAFADIVFDWFSDGFQANS